MNELDTVALNVRNKLGGVGAGVLNGGHAFSMHTSMVAEYLLAFGKIGHQGDVSQ